MTTEQFPTLISATELEALDQLLGELNDWADDIEYDVDRVPLDVHQQLHRAHNRIGGLLGKCPPQPSIAPELGMGYGFYIDRRKQEGL